MTGAKPVTPKGLAMRGLLFYNDTNSCNTLKHNKLTKKVYPRGIALFTKDVNRLVRKLLKVGIVIEKIVSKQTLQRRKQNEANNKKHHKNC
tara:strand:- start:280 stop:552 length:273 start_codon:yes stop_codon:yes gene_type:complete